MRKSLLPLLMMFSLLLSSADAQEEDEGTTLSPYTGLSIARISEQWSPGFVFGCELDFGKNVYADVRYQLHDILTSSEIVPWDGTLRGALGAYWAYEVVGISSKPYVAFTVARLSQVEQWSVGTAFGVMGDFDPLYVTFEYQMHDILTGEGVYGWSNQFEAIGGVYW